MQTVAQLGHGWNRYGRNVPYSVCKLYPDYKKYLTVDLK